MTDFSCPRCGSSASIVGGSDDQPQEWVACDDGCGWTARYRGEPAW